MALGWAGADGEGEGCWGLAVMGSNALGLGLHPGLHLHLGLGLHQGLSLHLGMHLYLGLSLHPETGLHPIWRVHGEMPGGQEVPRQC